MADEEKAEAAESKGSSGLILKIAIIAAIIIVPATAAVVTYRLVLAPILAENAPTPEPEESKIPPTAQTSTFDQSFVTVIMPDPNVPASLLLFSVSFECANLETAALVEGHKARFNDMVTQLHSFRTREELNDPLVKESIQRQARQKANAILARLQDRPDPNIRITAVFHDRFAVQDQL